MSGVWRTGAVVILAVLLTVVDPSPAGADPPGPTDYRTEILSVTPPADGIELEVIGGDSFMLLTARRGVEVEVVGYNGEPYLRFDPDGVVWRNERSPSRWLNEDRYGDADLPAIADAGAEPEWVVVSRAGSYAWHDHRTHWMNDQRPPGKLPGDTVLEAAVPLVVDGTPVVVEVRSVVLAGPSALPAIAGGAVGALVAAGLWLRRRDTGLAVAVAGTATAATISGGVAFWSVPSETEPSLLLWGLPSSALVIAGLSLTVTIARRDPTVRAVLLTLAGVELLWWAWTRRAGLDRALIPTDAPLWLDRAVIAGSFVVGIAALAGTAALHAGGRTTR